MLQLVSTMPLLITRTLFCQVLKLAAGFSEAAAVAGQNEVTIEEITVKIIELLATFFTERSGIVRGIPFGNTKFDDDSLIQVAFDLVKISIHEKCWSDWLARAYIVRMVVASRDLMSLMFESGSEAFTTSLSKIEVH